MDKMNSNCDTTKKSLVCPICGKEFDNVHDFAKHMNDHSIKERITEEEIKNKRLEDQKKYDRANLDKLHEAYVRAGNEYFNAKKSFDKKYNNNVYKNRTLYDIIDELFEL